MAPGSFLLRSPLSRQGSMRMSSQVDRIRNLSRGNSYINPTDVAASMNQMSLETASPRSSQGFSGPMPPSKGRPDTAQPTAAAAVAPKYLATAADPSRPGGRDKHAAMTRVLAARSFRVHAMTIQPDQQAMPTSLAHRIQSRLVNATGAAAEPRESSPIAAAPPSFSPSRAPLVLQSTTSRRALAIPVASPVNPGLLAATPSPRTAFADDLSARIARPSSPSMQAPSPTTSASAPVQAGGAKTKTDPLVPTLARTTSGRVQVTVVPGVGSAASSGASRRHERVQMLKKTSSFRTSSPGNGNP